MKTNKNYITLKEEFDFSDYDLGEYGEDFINDFLDATDDILDKDGESLNFDFVHEFSNDRVDIYYDDLYDWVSGNDEEDRDTIAQAMEDVIQEGLISFNDYSFTNHIQAAQFWLVEQDIYNHAKNIIQVVKALKGDTNS